MRRFLLATAILGVISAGSYGQSLQDVLEDVEVGDHWDYNDWEAASAAAKRSGKPVLALFR
jgi:hypothetical protein